MKQYDVNMQELNVGDIVLFYNDFYKKTYIGKIIEFIESSNNFIVRVEISDGFNIFPYNTSLRKLSSEEIIFYLLEN